MKIILIVAILAIVSVGAIPKQPLWQNKFSYQFGEEQSSNAFLTHIDDHGTYIYDYSTKTELVERSNGNYDALCKANGMRIFQTTPCDNYVVDGNRFLYYPEDGECCFCCSEANGCGMITPDWAINATFVSDNETINGVPVFKWLMMGHAPNYLYETQEVESLDRQTVRIDNAGLGSVDRMDFDLKTRNVDFQPIKLPGQCKVSNTCAVASACTFFRTLKNYF